MRLTDIISKSYIEAVREEEACPLALWWLSTPHTYQELLDDHLDWFIWYVDRIDVTASIHLHSGITSLEFPSLTSAEGLTIPASVTSLNLSALTSAKGLTIPAGVREVNLSSLTSAEGLTIPAGVAYLSLRSLTSAEGLAIPASVTWLYAPATVKEELKKSKCN